MKQAVGVFAVLCVTLLLGRPSVVRAQDPALLEEGAAVYKKRCVICHGDKGDGKGLMGIIHRAQQNGLVVSIYPRDFTAGIYKFRSTPSGSLPTDDDLMRIITDGIPRAGMPSHVDVPLKERKAVVEFIKTFSKRWQEDAGARTPIGIGKPPAGVGSSASAERGRKVYEEMQCAKCHGDGGRGDGPSSDTLQDSWGDKILAFDFTSGPLKGGSTPDQIYRTFTTGLDGTPMPSYQESLTPEQSWDLVSYCLELMKGQTSGS